MRSSIQVGHRHVGQCHGAGRILPHYRLDIIPTEWPILGLPCWAAGWLIRNGKQKPRCRQWQSQDGNKQNKTTWFRVSVWNKQAEALAEYLVKGKQVMVVGEVEEARVYTDRDGNPRANIEVKAQNIRLLGGRQHGDATDNVSVDNAESMPF